MTPTQAIVLGLIVAVFFYVSARETKRADRLEEELRAMEGAARKYNPTRSHTHVR